MSDPGRGPGATPPSRPCRSYRRLPVGSSAPLDRSPAGSCQAGPVTQQPWRDENIEVSLLVFGAVLVYPPALFCVRPLTSEVGRRTSTRGRQRSTGVHCASCPAPDHAPCRSDRPRNARRLPVRRAPTAGASTQERRRWPRTAARWWAQPGLSPTRAARPPASFSCRTAASRAEAFDGALAAPGRGPLRVLHCSGPSPSSKRPTPKHPPLPGSAGNHGRRATQERRRWP